MRSAESPGRLFDRGYNPRQSRRFGPPSHRGGLPTAATGKDDVWGIWAGRLSAHRQLAATVFDGNVARLSAAYWGAELSSGCRFYGRTLFRRAAGSRLVVGERCIFRSAAWSNQVGLNRPCMLSTVAAGAELRIGTNCGFSGTVLAAVESIVLEDRVVCGANVTITDTDWHGLRASDRRGPAAHSPVHVARDVWIGMNATILKGVTIGEEAVIAAGSIVTDSVPAGVVVAGNPARVVREL
jgi:acetyltransferase-like isoleucine patch superfamily enzyme